LIELVAPVRPGIALRLISEGDDVVVHGGGEVIRLPVSEEAVADPTLGVLTGLVEWR
jgi:hypothetical protein